MQGKILITGASGQLGSVLTMELQRRFGVANIIASDLKQNETFIGCFEVLDVTNFEAVNTIVSKYNIIQIYHLVAILSANGEKHPLDAWELNMKTFFNVLEASRINKVKKIFFPSSIAVYGDNAPEDNTSQDFVLSPSTVYGISKVAGENWANYYFEKYGLDIRSLRYPGIIGHQSLPGGGTTDYAVDIFHKAVNNEKYECFLSASTTLPMIYMDDAIRATIELMEAPLEKISVKTSYNISGMSFTPEELHKSIQKIHPEFEIIYKPDFRQNIADSWPNSIDDSHARNDWNWKPKYDLSSMTLDMIKNLEEKYCKIQNT